VTAITGRSIGRIQTVADYTPTDFGPPAVSAFALLSGA
jgi:hypothetical protein